MALSPRMLEGLAVAALALGDSDGSLALPGLSPALQAEIAPALRRLASADGPARRAFLRAALTRPAIDPRWIARLGTGRTARSRLSRIGRAAFVLAQLARAR